MDFKSFLRAAKIQTTEIGVDFWSQFQPVFNIHRFKTLRQLYYSHSIKNLNFAVAFCSELGILFELLSLDSESVQHECWKPLSSSQMTIDVLKLPTLDINGIKAQFPFYMTRGDINLLL